jgi:hypothetical protein
MGAENSICSKRASSARGDPIVTKSASEPKIDHLVVAPDGTLYANTWSGRYFPNAPPAPGGFLIA